MEPIVCSDKKLANAVSAKSARACDNCIKKRARWYCAADDAFLCQSCDSSVHSANPLARRHERVLLKTSSSSSIKSSQDYEDESRNPTWHQGFTRKPRTPRLNKKNNSRPDFNNYEPVPEINCSEENSYDDLYRVPIFDPFVTELCTTSADSINGLGLKPVLMNDFNMNHFLPTEMDLAEFAADVESLLGNGLENEVFDIEGLGILDCHDEREKGSRLVKVEGQESGVINLNHHQVDGELNFDYDSPVLGEGEDNKGFNHVMVNNFQVSINNNNNNRVSDDHGSRKIFLRLDYDGVMSSWDDQRSPWMTGERPDLDSGESWSHCVDICGTMHGYGGTGMLRGIHSSVMGDRGREARVSRYREKRRTRLFSKKIRYEVRKLNAEKRPRMKGRFVKRSNFVAAHEAAFTFAQ